MRQAILVFAALGGLANGAIGATVNVSPGQSIQSAINGASDGDEIVVAPGTYDEAIDFTGKAITLRSSGGPDVTTIDASGLSTSVVTCKSSEGSDTVLDGFTVTGGEGTLWLTKTLGGGMYINLSEPTVRRCIFLENSAVEGGGMYSFGQDPTITDCDFIGNTSTFEGLGGAGLFSKFSDPTLTNCRFLDNISPTVGGGVYILNGNPSLINCIFSDNIGFIGAGAYFANGDPTLANCTFSGNTATVVGGAFRSIESSTLANNCIFWGNSPDEINFDTSAVVTVNHSDIMGGWSGPGTGNNDSDPMFVDPASGDYRLGEGSPCIDAGDNAAVPADVDTDLDGNERIVNVVDLGPYEFAAPPPTGGPPAAPSGLVATAVSMSEIDLSWTDNATDEDGFEIERSLNGATWTLVASLGANSTSFTDEGLAPDTTYSYRVLAFNDSGYSDASNWASATTDPEPPGPPAAPSDLVATRLSTSEISLSWTDNATDEDGFEIDRSLNGATWTLVASLGANSTSFTDEGLAPDTTYFYRVVAFNDSGYSNASNWASATTNPEPPGPPAAPSDLVATALSASGISLSWTDNATDEDGFEIDRSPNGATWTLVASLGANSTSFTDEGLAPDTTYFYRVVAFNTSGYSDESDWASATTDPEPPGPPAPPSDLVATALSTSEISLSWADNAVDENGFDVERSVEGGPWQHLASLGANVTSFTDAGLSPETTASYRVIAYSAFGDSDYSNVASATTAPAPATNMVLPLINLTVSLGNLQSGDLPQLEASDNDRLVVRAVTQGNKRRVNLVVASNSPHANVSRLDLTVEARAVSPVKMRVYLKNFNNDRWVRLGTYELTSADRVFEFPAVSNPNRFIRNDDGRVQVRIRTVAQKNQTPGGYELKLDEVRVDITP